jgi:type IV secretion system protein VirB3
MDNLDISTVFKALSKPTSLMGVDYNYLAISSTVVVLLFIFTKSFFVLLLFLPLHLIGWILFQIDPHIFKIILVRAEIGMTRNKSLWGCQSYGE